MKYYRSIVIITVALAIVLLAGILAAAGATPAPAPALAHAAPPLERNAQIGSSDDAWSRVKEAGQIVVGTSADYPPFEYYDENFELDGFDIALMDAIAAKLGVEVEYKDFVFDGLARALLLNQVDAAISALSVTPERQAVVDFSNVYYVGEDAILARKDSGLGPIETVEDMADYRLGVERGSVYESWLRTSLVDTGLMPAGNLFSYLRAEDAVRDLKEDRVELVAMDRLPAEAFALHDGVELVGQDLNMQRFAIALPKGSSSLMAEINGALTELQNEGRIALLTRRYLDMDQVPQLPSPTPTPVPCVDGMGWVQDLNYNDNNMKSPPVMSPGQGFVKGWRVRNAGTCTWDTGYSLVYTRGNAPEARMGGEPVPITRLVPPGDTYDLKVDLVAPKKPGTYQGFWNMQNGEGEAFGQRIWVGIRVPAPATPTPRPTQPPTPQIQFSVDRTSIRAGECVAFRWNVENVREVYFYAQGQPWQLNGVAGHDSRTECPGQTTTYELRVIKRDGSTDIRQIRIDVQQTGTPPVIQWFAVKPGRIELGECIEIQWQVGGTVTNVTLYRHSRAIWENAPSSAVKQDCPRQTGEKRYHIRATGPGGVATAEDYTRVFDKEPR